MNQYELSESQFVREDAYRITNCLLQVTNVINIFAIGEIPKQPIEWTMNQK